MCVSTYVCMYVIRMYIQVSMPVCMYVRINACTYVFMYALCAYVYMYVCIYRGGFVIVRGFCPGVYVRGVCPGARFEILHL